MTQALTRRDRLVSRAGNAVAKAIRDGRLLPLADLRCSDCGKPAKCYDHRDYTQPLKVVPVCKGCNNRRGPGWPYPEKTDGAQWKHGVVETGYRWSGMEAGEGYAPLSARLAVGINLELMPCEKIIGATFETRRSIPELGEKTWKARADYFKRRDPWYV